MFKVGMHVIRQRKGIFPMKRDKGVVLKVYERLLFVEDEYGSNRFWLRKYTQPDKNELILERTGR